MSVFIYHFIVHYTLVFVVVPQMSVVSMITDEFLEEKRNALKARIALIAAGGSLAAALPIPGTGYAADVAILKGETKFYREQFGIDDASMARHSEKYKIPVNELRSNVGVTSADIMEDPLAYRHFLDIPFSRHVLDFLPILNTVCAVSSMVYITDALERILNLCLKEARYLKSAICEKYNGRSRYNGAVVISSTFYAIQRHTQYKH